MESAASTAINPAPLSKNEGIKTASRFLRGTLLEELADTSTGAISEDAAQLIKFHGSYLQDDRDQRNERRRLKLEKAFSFMVRVRVPGGICTPDQWLVVDRIADRYANGTIKLTTRQAFQLHGVLKGNLQATIREINAALMDTLAACGDVNRNVMCNPNPHASEAHAEAYELACAISRHLSPRTRAYHEIWIDGQLTAGGETEEEPIYGRTYLPRKFKIGIALPPTNEVDVFSQDLGLIAILDEGRRIAGYNITVGGGMGMSHGQTETFPRLGDLIGFCRPEEVLGVAEAVLLLQRDHGDRSNRKHARLKYTIEDRGVEWFVRELAIRRGVSLEPARPFHFTTTGDRYGWAEGVDGLWHLTLFIENGRVADRDGARHRSGLRELALRHGGDFRLTPNQHLIVGRVPAGQKASLEQLLLDYGLDAGQRHSGLRRNAIACVALPTCGLALAESERHLPALLDRLEPVLADCGLSADEITIRNTGCPNGCARPYLAEIGLVGRAPGKFNLYLGAARNGTRLNKLYKEAVREEDLVGELAPLLHRYAKERWPEESFGDFAIRAGWVAATTAGRDFHATR